MSSKIPLSVVQGKAFVWDVEHARQLRSEHHICGLLLGTLPQLSQQNVFLGLPLQLLPEEVVLLLNKQLVYLVDDAKAHQPATAEQREHYVQSREAAITEQKRSAASSATEHKKAMEAKFADKIAAKRAERAAKRAELNATKPSAAHQTEAEAGLVALAAPEPETAETSTAKATLGQAAKEKEPAEDVSQVAHHIKIRGPSQGLPWYQPDRFTYDTLEEAKQAGLWSYPSTPEETSRCQVFQDLWEKGNYMGNGLRFGGSFLVYPDDPLRYHSHFSTTILQDTTVPLSPTDIVSSGRLATAVKKAHLLCAPVRDARANDEERVQYFSLEWASMG